MRWAVGRMFQKLVVVDCRGHILGRLASIIAKELLNGQNVVAVRCEEIVKTGRKLRNKMTYSRFLRKRECTKPSRGPYHFRAPSRVLWRTVRGMIPHKTKRGAAAMERLKVFDGVPPPYDKMKRMVVSDALAVTRLRPGRRTTVLGNLMSELGWKHKEAVDELEAKRIDAGKAFYAEKKKLMAKRTKLMAKA